MVYLNGYDKLKIRHFLAHYRRFYMLGSIIYHLRGERVLNRLKIVHLFFFRFIHVAFNLVHVSFNLFLKNFCIFLKKNLTEIKKNCIFAEKLKKQIFIKKINKFKIIKHEKKNRHNNSEVAGCSKRKTKLQRIRILRLHYHIRCSF